MRRDLTDQDIRLFLDILDSSQNEEHQKVMISYCLNRGNPWLLHEDRSRNEYLIGAHGSVREEASAYFLIRNGVFFEFRFVTAPFGRTFSMCHFPPELEELRSVVRSRFSELAKPAGLTLGWYGESWHSLPDAIKCQRELIFIEDNVTEKRPGD